MELIHLAHGKPANPEMLRAYFNTIFEAELIGDTHPVNLDHVWRIGYASKEAAVKILKRKFVQDVDYQRFVQKDEREIGATTTHIYKLTVSCFEYFAVRRRREIFTIYAECRKIVQNMVRQPALPNFADPVAAARAWADAEEGKRLIVKQLELETHKKEAAQADAKRLLQVASWAEEQAHAAQLTIEAQAPAVEFFEIVVAENGDFDMEETAKILDIPGMGRTKLIRELKEKGIILKSSGLPAARYQAHFRVVHSTYQPRAGRIIEKNKVLLRAKSVGWLKTRLTE